MLTVSRPTEPLGPYSGKPRPRLYDSVIEVLRVHRYCQLIGVWINDGYCTR